MQSSSKMETPIDVFCHHINQIDEPFVTINRRLIKIEPGETPSYDLLMNKIIKKFENKLNTTEIELFWEYKGKLVGLSNDEINDIFGAYDEKSTISIYFTAQVNDSLIGTEHSAKKQKTNDQDSIRVLLDITEIITLQIGKYVDKRLFQNPKSILNKKAIEVMFSKEEEFNMIESIIGDNKISMDKNDSLISANPLFKKMFQLEITNKCHFEYIFNFAMNFKPSKTYNSELGCSIEHCHEYLFPVKTYINNSESSHLDLVIDQLQRISSQQSIHDKSSSLQSNTAFNDQNISSYRLCNLKPDWRIQDNYGRILERGEVKQDESLLELARDELVDKCLNQHQYGDIQVIFGSLLAGNTFHTYLIDFRPTCRSGCGKRECSHEKVNKFDSLSLVRSYNLNIVTDRVVLIWHRMIITEICRQMSLAHPPDNTFHKLYQGKTLERRHPIDNNLMAEVNFDYVSYSVEKIVYNKPHSWQIIMLNNFYELILVKKKIQKEAHKEPIKNTVKCIEFKETPATRQTASKLIIVTCPLGLGCDSMKNIFDSDKDEFYRAIVCVMKAALSMHANGFVHCDIRWPNVIYDQNSDTYLLIDFENIKRLCDNRRCKKHEAGECLSNAIIDAAYIIHLFELAEGYEDIEQENEELFSLVKKLKKIRKESNSSSDTIYNRMHAQIHQNFWRFYETNVRLLDEDISDEEIDRCKTNCRF